MASFYLEPELWNNFILYTRRRNIYVKKMLEQLITSEIANPTIETWIRVKPEASQMFTAKLNWEVEQQMREYLFEKAVGISVFIRALIQKELQSHQAHVFFSKDEKQPAEKIKLLMIIIKPEMHRELKVLSAYTDISMSRNVISMIRREIKNPSLDYDLISKSKIKLSTYLGDKQVAVYIPYYDYYRLRSFCSKRLIVINEFIYWVIKKELEL